MFLSRRYPSLHRRPLSLLSPSLGVDMSVSSPFVSISYSYSHHLLYTKFGVLSNTKKFSTVPTSSTTVSLIQNPLPNFTDQDKQYMQKALELATEAGKEDEVPIVAVIVRSTHKDTLNTNQIIGIGKNSTRNTRNITAHAEILALQMAQRTENTPRLDGVTLYVTVEPCIMCFGACLLHHIHRIVYSIPNPKFGYINGRPFITPYLRDNIDNYGIENPIPSHIHTEIKDTTSNSSIIHSITKPSINDTKSSESYTYNHRIIIENGLLADESRTLLQNFFRKKRN